MESSKIPKGILGQPTCHTHPHMIPNGQLTCGITQEEYKERRDNLVAKLLEESEHIHKSHIVSIIGFITAIVVLTHSRPETDHGRIKCLVMVH